MLPHTHTRLTTCAHENSTLRSGSNSITVCSGELALSGTDGWVQELKFSWWAEEAPSLLADWGSEGMKYGVFPRPPDPTCHTMLLLTSWLNKTSHRSLSHNKPDKGLCWLSFSPQLYIPEEQNPGIQHGVSSRIHNSVEYLGANRECESTWTFFVLLNQSPPAGHKFPPPPKEATTCYRSSRLCPSTSIFPQTLKHMEQSENTQPHQHLTAYKFVKIICKIDNRWKADKNHSNVFTTQLCTWFEAQQNMSSSSPACVWPPPLIYCQMWLQQKAQLPNNLSRPAWPSQLTSAQHLSFSVWFNLWFERCEARECFSSHKLNHISNGWSIKCIAIENTMNNQTRTCTAIKMHL